MKSFIFVIKNQMIENTSHLHSNRDKILDLFKTYPKLEGYSIIANSCVKKIFGNDSWHGAKKIDHSYSSKDENCWCDTCIPSKCFKIW